MAGERRPVPLRQVCSPHLLCGESGASSPELIQPFPALVSTSTQLPERLISFNCSSLAAVPTTRPFLPGSDRMFAGPRFTTMMTSFFGAAAGLSGRAAGWSRIGACRAAGGWAGGVLFVAV
jgi:hypothetical protein